MNLGQKVLAIMALTSATPSVFARMTYHVHTTASLSVGGVAIVLVGTSQSFLHTYTSDIRPKLSDSPHLALHPNPQSEEGSGNGTCQRRRNSANDSG
jgi:hypothetical protein